MPFSLIVYMFLSVFSMTNFNLLFIYVFTTSFGELVWYELFFIHSAECSVRLLRNSVIADYMCSYIIFPENFLPTFFLAPFLLHAY